MLIFGHLVLLNFVIVIPLQLQKNHSFAGISTFGITHFYNSMLKDELFLPHQKLFLL